MERAEEHVGESDWVLQQDNAPAHTANSTIELLEDIDESRGFTLPISLRENLWARIKDELSRNSPPPNTAALNERVAELID